MKAKRGFVMAVSILLGVLASTAFATAGGRVSFEVGEPFVIEDRLFQQGVLELVPVFRGDFISVRLDGEPIAVMDARHVPDTGPLVLHLQRDPFGILHATAISGVSRSGERERERLRVSQIEPLAGTQIARFEFPATDSDRGFDPTKEVVLIAHGAARR